METLLMRINVYGKKPRKPPVAHAVQCSVRQMTTCVASHRSHALSPNQVSKTNRCSLMNMHAPLAHAPLVLKFKDRALNLCLWNTDWTEFRGTTWAQLQSEYLHIDIVFVKYKHRFLQLQLKHVCATSTSAETSSSLIWNPWVR